MSDDLKVGLEIRTTTPGAEQVPGLEQDVRDLGAASSKAATQQNQQAAASDRQGRSAGDSAELVGKLGAALGGIAVGQLVRDFAQMAAAQEANLKALEQLTGSAAAGSAEMDYLRGAANRLGVNLDDATKAYVGLSAATKGTNLEGQNTRAIFEAVVGAMSKLGKSSAETQNALLAVSQMASKGTISMEDLRGQLGEALPGAMQAAAKAMGVTVAELDKMVSSGTVTADQLLPRLADQLNTTFGSSAPDTLNASFAQLSNTITASVGVMTESGVATNVLKGAMTVLTAAVSALMLIFGSAAEAVGLFGKVIAAAFLGIRQAMTGDFSGAAKTFKENLADATNQAANNITKLRDSLRKVPDDAKGAGENTKAALSPAATAADQLAAALSGAGTAAAGMGGQAGAAADTIAQKFRLDTLQGVLDLADAFVIAGAKSGDMSKSVQAAVEKMSGAELSGFAANLKTAFETGQIDAQRFAELNNTVLAQSFKGLGIDVDQAFGGISAKTGDAINRIDALVAALSSAGQTGPQAARAIGDALATALNRTDTLAGVDAIRARIETLRNALGNKIADGLLQQATEQAKKLQAQIDAITPGINSLSEAYKTLGMTSSEQWAKQAADSKSAYEYIRNSGVASAEDVRQAFIKYASDAIKANGGVASETLKVEAAIRGVTLATNDLGKSIITNTNDQSNFNKTVQQGVVYLGEANDAWQKGYHKPTSGVDKEGFATSDSGQTIVAGSQVNTKLGVINYLKSAGLTEQEAIQLANQYIGNDGQPIWNHPIYGRASDVAPFLNIPGYNPSNTPEQNLNDAVAKMLSGRYGGAGSATSAGVRKFGDTAPTPDQAQASHSVTINLKLPNGSTTSMQANSQADAQKLIDALKQAGLVGALA